MLDCIHIYLPKDICNHILSYYPIIDSNIRHVNCRIIHYNMNIYHYLKTLYNDLELFLENDVWMWANDFIPLNQSISKRIRNIIHLIYINEQYEYLPYEFFSTGFLKLFQYLELHECMSLYFHLLNKQGLFISSNNIYKKNIVYPIYINNETYFHGFS